MGSADKIERARLRQHRLVLVVAASGARALFKDAGAPTDTKTRNRGACAGITAVEGSFGSGNVHVMIGIRGEEEDNLLAHRHGELRVFKVPIRPVNSGRYIVAVAGLAGVCFPRRTVQSGEDGVE